MGKLGMRLYVSGCVGNSDDHLESLALREHPCQRNPPVREHIRKDEGVTVAQTQTAGVGPKDFGMAGNAFP